MTRAGRRSRVGSRVQAQVRRSGFAATMPGMSAGGLLLRVVLMLSLLFNGLNVGMAAPMALALLPATAAAATDPPCHSQPASVHATHGTEVSTAHVSGHNTPAPHDGDHCRLKDCLRNCAQQPSLSAQVLWLPSPPPSAPAPLSQIQTALPTPPLDRISRPPIA